MNTPSPFSDTRFEHEFRHLYYLEEDLYEKLQRTKPCFLIGSRGTGKTTLLKSLSWRERLSNEGLKSQFKGRAFYDFIGIYIKLPDVQLDAISIWLKDVPEIPKRAIYSRYLELIQIQEVFEAVAELESLGELEFSADAEQKTVRDLLDIFETELYIPGEGYRRPITFSDLSRSTRGLRKYVEKASQQNISALSTLEVLGSPAQLCYLSREVAKHLTKIVAPRGESRHIFYKVCFDEAETLDEFGVQLLNSWVRLSTDALSHVISFVSKPESLSATLVPNLSVQSADANTLDLDDIKDKQFRSFTEGVTTLRLQEFVRRSEEKLSVPDSFSTEAIFGKLNLNFLLENALRESVSPFAKKLLEEARVRSGGTSRVIAGLKRGDDTSLPIYETYLEMRTKRAPPAEDEPAWSKRRVTSQLTRKAMVGAYLSIMTELRTAPRYAYADMILQLSDSCIRDFLNNLDYIYQASHRSLPSFLSAIPVKATTQNVGLLGASKAKFKSLPTRGVNHPSSTAKLITGLAKLTQLLQSQSKDGVRHLKTTERGIFDLAIAADTDITARAVTLIIGAAEAGFLKTLTGSKLILAFRVHTSLAPAYGFSYRGAYYHVPIQASDILSFADALDDREIEKLVALLFDRIDGNRSDLFSEADYD